MALTQSVWVQEIARHVDTTQAPVDGVPVYVNRLTLRTTNPGTTQGPSPVLPPQDGISDADISGFAEGSAVTITYTPAGA